MMLKILSFLAPIHLNGNETHHPMEDWSMMGGWWVWIIILIAVFLILLFVYFIIGEDEGDRNTSSEKSPEKILDERYARGEISRDEYKKMKKEMRR